MSSVAELGTKLMDACQAIAFSLASLIDGGRLLTARVYNMKQQAKLKVQGKRGR
jgi:hypothetical protein